MERAYPTRNGVPVHVDEIGLAPSRLDPSLESSYNNHHYYFESTFYRPDFIFNALRNLEFNQERMLRDQHNMGKLALHTLFGPPERPTYEYAMDRLDIAHQTGERFKIWDKVQKRYVYQDLTDIHWKQLLMRYKEAA